MKHQLLVAGAVLCALVMTGCSKEVDGATSVGKQAVMSMQITAENSQTRADYVNDGSKMDFSWRSGDELSITINGVADNENCRLSTTENGKSVSFSGNVTTFTGTKDIYAFYPYNAIAYKVVGGDVPATSTATLTLPTTQQYTIGGAISNSFMVGVGTATASGSSIDASASLKQVMSIIKLNITNAPGKVTGVKLKCSESVFPTIATVKLSDATISNPGSLMSELSMAVSDGTSGTDKSISFVMLPTDLTGKDITVDVTFEGGKTKSIKKVGTNFERNIHYVMTFDGSEVNDVQSISIKTLPSKTVYTLGENLSIDDMVLKVTYADGTIKENSAPSTDWIQGFDSSVPAQQQTLTLTLGGKQISFDVKILPVKVNGDKIVSVIDSDFTSITFPNGIRTVGSEAFSNKNIRTSELSFPASLSAIEKAAFAYCKNLKTVDLSRTSIQELPEEAFAFSGIKTIILPTSLKIIGKDAFYACADLSAIDLSHTSVQELQNGAFGKSGISSISLPATFKIVGEMVFVGTNKLKELTLPEGSEEIDSEAFSLSSIQKILLPNTIYRIGRAFYNCPELTTIETYGTRTTILPMDKPAVIGHECFIYSPKLTVLNIPSSVAEIGASVLSKCQVKTLVLPASIKKLDFNAFGNAVSLDEISLMSPTMVTASDYPVPQGIKKIRVPQNLVEAYKQDKFWKPFAEKIVAF